EDQVRAVGRHRHAATVGVDDSAAPLPLKVIDGNVAHDPAALVDARRPHEVARTGDAVDDLLVEFERGFLPGDVEVEIPQAGVAAGQDLVHEGEGAGRHRERGDEYRAHQPVDADPAGGEGRAVDGGGQLA